METEGKTEKKTEMKEVAVKSPSFTLPNKKVKIVPVIKKGWLSPGHEAEFLYQHATNSYCVPKHEYGGGYVNPLTAEEARSLEADPRLSLSVGDLSIHKDKEENFWVKKFKNIRLGKDPITLDLSDPMDYMKYKVLLLWKDDICPLEGNPRNKASYKYAIVDLDYEDSNKSKTTNALTDAFIEYSKIREDKQTLADILFLLKNQRVSTDQSKEWLQGQVGEFVQKNPVKFLEIINDDNMKVKLLITKAVTYNAMTRENTVYRTAGGDFVGADLESAIRFLNNESNQDIRLMIEQQVRNAEGQR